MGSRPRSINNMSFQGNFWKKSLKIFVSWIEMFCMCCWGMENNMSTELKRLKTGQIVTSTFFAQVLRGVRVRAEAEEAAGEADHCDRGGFCSHQKDARRSYEGWVSDLRPHFWKPSPKQRFSHITNATNLENVICHRFPLPYGGSIIVNILNKPTIGLHRSTFAVRVAETGTFFLQLFPKFCSRFGLQLCHDRACLHLRMLHDESWSKKAKTGSFCRIGGI